MLTLDSYPFLRRKMPESESKIEGTSLFLGATLLKQVAMGVYTVPRSQSKGRPSLADIER